MAGLDTKIIRISVMHGFKEGFTWSNFGIQGKMAIYNWKYIDYIVCQNEAMVADASKNIIYRNKNFVVYINREFCTSPKT